MTCCLSCSSLCKSYTHDVRFWFVIFFAWPWWQIQTSGVISRGASCSALTFLRFINCTVSEAQKGTSTSSNTTLYEVPHPGLHNDYDRQQALDLFIQLLLAQFHRLLSSRGSPAIRLSTGFVLALAGSHDCSEVLSSWLCLSGGSANVCFPNHGLGVRISWDK